MKQILKLVFLLVIGQTAFAQAPSNYTNINGRYRWIAGMFDSTFHIPKGSTPSLRTGGSTNSGGLFYNTSDSSVYTYTGTQWIKLRGSINPSDTTNKYVTQVYKKSGSDSIFYVKGGVHTWAFNDSTGSPGGGGGGKVYYFNGGVSMGTFGGFTMYELGDTANTGAAANFTRSTTGNIANFITDPNKPGLLQIPAGVWTVDAWLSETGGGANHAEIYVQVEKWDGSTITTIATSPIEEITEGGTPNLYTWSVSIPTTTLAVTDRIILQFYIQNTNGKTVTLYTQNGYVGEVHTTFTTGIGAINGLTAPAQYLVTSTSGTDFNINSSTATHIFNLPTASATNRGALSTTDWSTFNSKIGGSGSTNYVSKFTGSGTIGISQIFDNGTNVGVGMGNSPTAGYMLSVGGKTRQLNHIDMDSPAPNTSNAINIQSGLSISIKGTGYLTLGSFGANRFSMFFGDNNNYQADLDGSNLSSGRRYLLPDATGTLALTSDLSSYVPTSRTITINGTSQDLSANRTYNVGTVTSVATNTGTGITGGTITTSGTIAADTLLLSTRAWRQKGVDSIASLINTRISGTTNYIPKFTSSSAIGNSMVTDDGTTVTVNGTSTVYFKVKASTNSGIDLLQDAAGTGYLWNRDNAAIQFGTNNTERMRLTSGGSLGIGTSSPAQKLTVAGDVQIGETANPGALRFIGAADKFNFIIGKQINVNNAFEITPSTAAGGTTFSTPAFVVTSGGNIGINTSSPNIGGVNKALTLNSAASTNSSYELAVNGTQLGAYFTLASSNAIGLYATQNGHIQFGTNNTERMRLDASGNLGLGTSAPTNKLDILTADNTGLTVRSTNYSGSFSPSGLGGMALTTNGAYPLFFYLNSATRMTLDASGNLGLGVSPANWATITPIQVINASFSGYSNEAHMNANYYYNAGGKYIASDYATRYVQTSGQHLWFTAPSGTAGNAISFTQAMTLDASGRLLIGGTSDNGGVRLYSSNGANGLPVTSGITQTYGALRLRGGDNAVLDFGLNSTNTWIQATDLSNLGNFYNILLNPRGGNVGIGTTSPSQLLHLNVASGSIYNRIQNNNNSLYLGLESGGIAQVSSDVSSLKVMASTYTSFETASAERMRITSGGLVGIGTSSPSGKLQVSSTTAGDDQIWLQSTTYTGGYSKLGYNANTGEFRITQNDGGVGTTFYTGTTPTERMRITSGGEHLINTTSDAGDYKLQVNGNVYGTGDIRLQHTNPTINLTNTTATTGKDWKLNSFTNGNFYIGIPAVVDALELTSSGNAIVGGSIKTAAPSGGTAAAWKLGERVASAGVTFNDQQYIQLDIGGTLYYLATVDLPMPEAYPQATSGPSNNYKMAPVQVKTTRDAEIEKLRKEIEELKQLIKNK